MEAKKTDFSKEMGRLADALYEFESALNALGYVMAKNGVLRSGLTITGGVIGCGITDGNELWHEIQYAEDLTDDCGVASISENANEVYDDYIKGM